MENKEKIRCFIGTFLNKDYKIKMPIYIVFSYMTSMDDSIKNCRDTPSLD